jgi:hypothetical protein
MDITESQLVRASVIDFWGTFASRDMEARFRSEHLAQDLRIAKFLAWMYVLTTAALALMDWTFKGATPTFLMQLIPRSLTMLSCVVLVLRLRCDITPSLLERWLLGWFSVNLVTELWAHSARTALEATLAGIFFVWALASLVPMRFSHQAATATVTSVGFMVLILGKRPEPALLALIALKLMLALTIGLFCSGQLHRARRQSFAAHLVERETGVMLEMALAEIKTLEAILPICSACKKIRREDDSWIGLDDYVSEKTNTRFSHGMCPDCMATFYPHYSRQNGKS